MRHWLQLIRVPNLFIVWLTLYLLQRNILLPAFTTHEILPDLSALQFNLLCLMTILATAAGYVINDWYDYPIDLINKPERVIVNKKITLRKAKHFYLALVGVGAWIATFLSAQTGDWGITLLYFFVSILLYAYAAKLKKTCLWGNLVVALLCALVAGLVWYTEWDAIILLGSKATIAAKFVNQLFIAYLGFAFITTLYREIVKDLEDMEGDKIGKANTLPLATSPEIAKWVAAFCGFLLLLSLFIWGWSHVNIQEHLAGALFLFSIFLLSGISLYLLAQAKTKTGYHQVSQFVKAILLLGLLYLTTLN